MCASLGVLSCTDFFAAYTASNLSGTYSSYPTPDLHHHPPVLLLALLPNLRVLLHQLRRL